MSDVQQRQDKERREGGRIKGREAITRKESKVISTFKTFVKMPPVQGGKKIGH